MDAILSMENGPSRFLNEKDHFLPRSAVARGCIVLWQFRLETVMTVAATQEFCD